MKNFLKTFIKFALAFALIFWLIDSGKLNLSLLVEVFKYPRRIIWALVGTIGIILIVALRYKLIIEHKSSVKIPYLKILKLNWIGMFFNAVLPGSVSGDLVKIFYIKQFDSKLSHKFLLGSIVIDRVVGLFGLILVLGFFTIMNYDELANLSPDVKSLLSINLILFSVVVLSLVSLFFFQKIPYLIAKPFENLPVFNKIIPIAIKTWGNLCEFKHRMLLLTGMSIVIQAGAIFLFWFVASPFSVGEFPFQYAFTLIPLGLISIAIPIAPSGMGVGHAVFNTLFGYAGIQNGADLFNIYFIIALSVNLLGAIPYLLNKGKKVDFKEIENAEDSN